MADRAHDVSAVYNSNLVLAGLPDVIWTEHKPVTDERCKQLDAVFHLSEILQ